MTTDTLRQVFGTLRTPNGSPFPNKSLKWFRERRATVAQGSSVVLDDPFIVTTDAAGEIDTSVMAGAYLVLAPLSDADRYFRVVVPDQAGPFDISSLIDGPTVEPDDLTQFEALVAKAKAWANAPEDSVVENGEFSAKHYAAESEDERQAAQEAREGAEAAVTNAETARDAAFVNANVYADTAAGLAGTTVGDQFQVAEGAWLVRYTHDAGPVATEVTRLLRSVAPDYANDGGTGDRTASVTVTVSGASLTTNDPSNLVDGAFENNTTDSIAFVPSAATAGEWIRFDFGQGAQRVISEAKWYQANTSVHGTWKWQGSNDGDTWADIGVGFTLGGATTQVLTELSANGTAYRFYRLFGVSGNMSGSPYLQEVEFKIDAQVTEGFQRVQSRFPDYFPTAKLAAAYFFDEGTDTEVPDVLGVYPIDLTLPTTPNVTRTGYGLKTELGLIQTPVLPNVRGQLVLYRTNKDGATGFIVSGGPAGSGDGTLQQNDDATSVDQTKMLGFGLDPFQPLARRARPGAKSSGT